MRDVHARARHAGDLSVAEDHHGLRRGGVAWQAELVTDGALAHHAAGAQARLLRVRLDHEPELGRVLAGAAHEVRVGEGHAIVREHDGARLLERREVGEALALHAHADRGGRTEPRLAHELGAPHEVGHQAGIVDRRRGVGHGDDRAEPARGGGGEAAREVFLDLLAGVAQVGVEVEEGGREQLLPRVELEVHCAA
mgnify:CR=1 FL=1